MDKYINDPALQPDPKIEEALISRIENESNKNIRKRRLKVFTEKSLTSLIDKINSNEDIVNNIVDVRYIVNIGTPIYYSAIVYYEYNQR